MKYLILIFGFHLSVMSISVSAQTRNSDFKVFDAIMIKDKPNLSSFGLSKINMIYEDSLLMFSPKFPKNTNERIKSDNKINRSLLRINNNYPICLDVESWLLEGSNNGNSVNKYVNLLKVIKSKKNNPIGYYGIIPHADLKIYQQYVPQLRGKKNTWLSEWDALNNKLLPIAKESTIVYPSCYTRIKSKDLWLKAFDLQIKKIKMISPMAKIYVFIWPQYYSPGLSYNNEYIDGEFWDFQLETIYSRCDGVVIWAPPVKNDKSREIMHWNNNLEWWKATLKFISKHNIKVS